MKIRRERILEAAETVFLERGFAGASINETRGEFLTLEQRAGLRQVRYHDLRHSFASNLLAAGVDIVTVSKALGHASVHITLTTYAHAVPKPRHGASDRMAALIGQGGNKMETEGWKIAPPAATKAAQIVDLAERVG